MNYESLADLIQQAEERKCKISQLVMEQQASQLERSEESLMAEMEEAFCVMEKAAADGVAPDLRSTSGLTGGDAYRLSCQVEQGKNLCGPMLGAALVKAIAVSELNAAMGKIVACPTAGSCGILPAAVLSLMEAKGLSRQECIRSLFTASAVGLVIAQNASLSGAQGGCQAECGSAAAKAAAALVELSGGSPEMVGHAVAIALKNVLGLVCDPVAGLVEIPCIKRNAAGVMGAYTAAELALAGIKSAIPADEVIVAMKHVGDLMPAALRETADGGLADTPTGRALYQKVFGKKE